MPFHIAVSGKGGTGKTTLSAVILRYLIRSGKGPALVIDADADGNLAQALGLDGMQTVLKEGDKVVFMPITMGG